VGEDHRRSKRNNTTQDDGLRRRVVGYLMYHQEQLGDYPLGFRIICVRQILLGDTYTRFSEEEEEGEGVETISSGVGLYPHAAVFNHSCIPNCQCFFDNYSNLLITTIAPVKKGQELTIGYVDLPYYSDSSLRREACKAEIWSQFRFDCDCKE
jgi:hypothetical protein